MSDRLPSELQNGIEDLVSARQIHQGNTLDRDPVVDSKTLANLTSDEAECLRDIVVKQYHQWKQGRANLEDTWRECWDSYLCKSTSQEAFPEQDAPDRSRVNRPVLFEAVEAIHTNVLNSMFPSVDRFFTVLGKTESDHKNAKVIEEFLRNKLNESGFFEKYAQFLKQSIITGNSVAAVPWLRKTKLKQVQKPVKVLGVTVDFTTETIEETVKNGPDFDVIDMFDFLIDPNEPDFEQANVIRRYKRSLNHMRRTGIYFNLEGLQATGDQAEDLSRQSRKSAFGLNNTEDTADGSQPGDEIVLYEAWGNFRVADTVFENYVCVIANEERVVRFEPNPYEAGVKPFVFTSFIPVPNEVYGIGAIEKSLGLQHAINTLTNQKLDVINISINNPFTYLINDDIFDPDTVVTRPGALIPVKSHDTLKPIQYLNNFTVAFNEIADLKSEVQEATGALKFFTGADSPNDNRRTATEVSALLNAGTQKFSYFIAHLQNTSLQPFLNIVFEHAKQFMNRPETLRILHRDGSLKFMEVLPELLRESRCTFRIESANNIMTRENELGSLVSFLRLASQQPEIYQRIDMVELYRKIYRRLGFQDEDQIFSAEASQEQMPNSYNNVDNV